MTGAARRLGRAIALGLGRSGFAVAVHYGGSAEEAEATVGELQAAGAGAVALPADLTQPEAIAELFRRLEERFGRLDVLVNSAATFTRQSLADIDAAAWDAVLAVNLRAPFLCLRQAADLMGRSPRADGEPAVAVNLADLSGVFPWRGYVHHGVSKAGVLHLTQAAALELAPRVRVNAVVPGAILPPPGVGGDSAEWQAVGEGLPLARVGAPDHVVETVLFLVANDFVTGTAVFVDGGEHLLGSSKR